MSAVFFRNRFTKEYNTKIIAHDKKDDIERCRMNDTLEEITKTEAFRLVQSVGHLGHSQLYGICLEGFEHNDKRRCHFERYGIEYNPVIVQG